MLLGGQFAVGDDKLGSGTFGTVFKGRDEVTLEEVAIKFENATIAGTKTFRREKHVLKQLNYLPGFPKLQWEGRIGDQDAIVMDLLGDDLNSLCKQTPKNQCLDIKSVLMVAMQMIDRLQALHSKGFVHNDLKPANMAIGRVEETKDTIHLIDFGQTVKFRWSEGMRTGIRLEPGTLLFSSIALHSHEVALPKHDMECLGYVLVYLMQRTLPWKFVPAGPKQKIDILAMKIACKETLCASLPREFGLYMDYVYGLDDTDTVDYNYVRALFENLYEQAGFVHDGTFPWAHTNVSVDQWLVPKGQTHKIRAVTALVPNVRAIVSTAIRSVWRERVNKVTPEVPCEKKSFSADASPVVAALKRAGAFDAAEQEMDDDCGTTKWPSVQSTRKPSCRPSTSLYF